MRRLIVLLCAKRSGSTAVFRMFQAHSGASIPHPDPSIELWEPNFWNYASEAIAGNPARFCERYPRAHPVVRGRVPTRDEDAFEMWDQMHERFGAVLFDKTPKLLVEDGGLDLLLRYRALGRDVRLIGLVRDPRDVIASQFERWGGMVEGDSPKRRERAWVRAYERLEALRKRVPVAVFRYEDMSHCPASGASAMLACCGLCDEARAYAHIRPVSVGRYSTTTCRALQAWSPGDAMCRLMALWHYDI